MSWTTMTVMSSILVSARSHLRCASATRAVAASCGSSHCMAMSTAHWLGTNSHSPSEAMMKNGCKPVRRCVCNSGCAVTPISSATASPIDREKAAPGNLPCGDHSLGAHPDASSCIYVNALLVIIRSLLASSHRFKDLQGHWSMTTVYMVLEILHCDWSDGECLL